MQTIETQFRQYHVTKVGARHIGEPHDHKSGGLEPLGPIGVYAYAYTTQALSIPFLPYHIIAKIKFPHSKTVFIYGVFTYTKDVREPASTYYAGSLDLNKGNIKYRGARE